MLIDDNEYGAPWNDVFYVVTYERDGKILEDIMTLSGPKIRSYWELVTQAEMAFNCTKILNIQDYNEVHR